MDIRLKKTNSAENRQLISEGLLPSSLEKSNGSGQLILKAVSGDDILGAMYFEDRGPEIELMSIAVRPEYQRIGIGTGMLSCFFKSLYYSELKPVHCYYVDESDMAYFDSFIKNCGFFYTERAQKIFTAAPFQRRKSETYHRLTNGAKSRCVLWCDLSKSQKENFLKRRMMEGDYIFSGINENALDEDLCFCRLDAEGEITSAAFIQRRDDKRYVLAYVYSKNHVGFSEVMGNTLSGFEIYCAMATLEVVAANEHTEKLIEKLFPDDIFESYIIDAEWNYSINSERRSI